jgi:hypothetical protein
MEKINYFLLRRLCLYKEDNNNNNNKNNKNNNKKTLVGNMGTIFLTIDIGQLLLLSSGRETQRRSRLQVVSLPTANIYNYNKNNNELVHFLSANDSRVYSISSNNNKNNNNNNNNSNDQSRLLSTLSK